MRWDVRLVALATIAFCGLTIAQLWDHLPMLLEDAPLSPRFGPSIRVGFAQTVLTLLAGVFLLAGKPWARLWLVLVSIMTLAIFTTWPPTAESLQATRAGVEKGGVAALFAVSWVLECTLALLTLVVLARARRDFSTLRWPAAVAVVAAALLFVTYQGREYSGGMQLAVEMSAAEAHELSEPASGEGIVRLRPTLEGRPIGDLTAKDISLSLEPYEVHRPDGAGSARDGRLVNRVFDGPLDVDWELRDGHIELVSVPAGHYVVTLSAGRRGGGHVHTRSRLTFATARGPVDADLPVEATILLREPGLVLGKQVRLRSPIRFRWDAVPGAERYQAQLWSKRNTARDFDVQLTVPEWELDVPAGTWILQVEAVGDNRSLATLQGEPEFVVAE